MLIAYACLVTCFFFSSRRRHTRCALVTGVQTCALPIYLADGVHRLHDLGLRILEPLFECDALLQQRVLHDVVVIGIGKAVQNDHVKLLQSRMTLYSCTSSLPLLSPVKSRLMPSIALSRP